MRELVRGLRESFGAPSGAATGNIGPFFPAPPWMRRPIDPPAGGRMNLPSKQEIKRIKDLMYKAGMARRVVLTPASTKWDSAKRILRKMSRLT